MKLPNSYWMPSVRLTLMLSQRATVASIVNLLIVIEGIVNLIKAIIDVALKSVRGRRLGSRGFGL